MLTHSVSKPKLDPVPYQLKLSNPCFDSTILPGKSQVGHLPLLGSPLFESVTAFFKTRQARFTYLILIPPIVSSPPRPQLSISREMYSMHFSREMIWRWSFLFCTSKLNALKSIPSRHWDLVLPAAKTPAMAPQASDNFALASAWLPQCSPL